MIPVLASSPHRPCPEMVLPVRIELTTSALPRMRSTTELRQHFVRERRAYGRRHRVRQPVDRPAGDGLESLPSARHLARMAGKDQEREERLAAALRENLRRRKAQSRKIETADKDDSPEG